MATTKPNTKILEPEAIDFILAMLKAVKSSPESYDQSLYPRPVNGGVCSTAFCAAGHIIIAKSPKLFAELFKRYEIEGRDDLGHKVDWMTEAMKVLGLDYGRIHGGLLFGTADVWPERFKFEYNQAYFRKAEKARANQRVRAFIAYWKYLIDTDMAYADFNSPSYHSNA